MFPRPAIAASNQTRPVHRYRLKANNHPALSAEHAPDAVFRFWASDSLLRVAHSDRSIPVGCVLEANPEQPPPTHSAYGARLRRCTPGDSWRESRPGHEWNRFSGNLG